MGSAGGAGALGGDGGEGATSGLPTMTMRCRSLVPSRVVFSSRRTCTIFGGVIATDASSYPVSSFPLAAMLFVLLTRERSSDVESSAAASLRRLAAAAATHSPSTIRRPSAHSRHDGRHGEFMMEPSSRDRRHILEIFSKPAPSSYETGISQRLQPEGHGAQRPQLSSSSIPRCARAAVVRRLHSGHDCQARRWKFAFRARFSARARSRACRKILSRQATARTSAGVAGGVARAARRVARKADPILISKARRAHTAFPNAAPVEHQ